MMRLLMHRWHDCLPPPPPPVLGAKKYMSSPLPKGKTPIVGPRRLLGTFQAATEARASMHAALLPASAAAQAARACS
jgi:hypothetical protein